MSRPQIWQDIADAVRRAIDDNLDTLDEDDLVERSDAVLDNLPAVTGEQITTASLLRRYRRELHGELCSGSRARTTYGSLEEELTDLTRAVVVTVEWSEGISIESAVLLALVLRAQGLDRFCALNV
jgi:hypothetical protein